MPRIDPEKLENIELIKVVDGPKYDARVKTLHPDYRLRTECVCVGGSWASG